VEKEMIENIKPETITGKELAKFLNARASDYKIYIQTFYIIGLWKNQGQHYMEHLA
jgi:hypothetical protein